MRIAAILIGSASALVAPQVLAQDTHRCDEPTYSAWTWRGSHSGAAKPISTDRFVAVEQRLAAAIERLETQSAVEIGPDEAGRYLVDSELPVLAEGEIYVLVRAVFPVTNPRVQLDWLGNDLAVFTAGMGCAPYTEHPLVVAVDRMPEKVHVSATAAL